MVNKSESCESSHKIGWEEIYTGDPENIRPGAVLAEFYDVHGVLAFKVTYKGYPKDEPILVTAPNIVYLNQGPDGKRFANLNEVKSALVKFFSFPAKLRSAELDAYMANVSSKVEAA